MTKKIFVEAINFIEERSHKMDELNKMFTEEFEDSVFYPYSKYNTVLIKVLQNVMQDQSDWIGYYCWDLDFGKKWVPGTITDKDGHTDIVLKTAEDLWNLLTSEQ